jgi:hypothetical protein
VVEIQSSCDRNACRAAGSKINLTQFCAAIFGSSILLEAELDLWITVESKLR